ncbi:MAG: hypothetical protein H0T48_04630 [Gemmatimonadaceae bacterium]|nr:hypothetical protein [Gemmatimonadaceae bacterium]
MGEGTDRAERSGDTKGAEENLNSAPADTDEIFASSGYSPGVSTVWGALGRFAQLTEPLWVAGLALAFIVRGSQWIPTIIQLAGRGGRVETAEWGVYLLLGTVFPMIVATLGLLAPQRVDSRWMIVVVSGLSAFAITYGLMFLWRAGAGSALAGAVMATVLLAGALFVRKSKSQDACPLGQGEMALLWFVLWLVSVAAFKLASWAAGAGWITQSPATPVILTLLAAAALHVTVMRRGATEPRWKLLPSDAPALLLFTFLSFRTYPIAEFYHWSFWVGPIEAVRQGGWLLWDVPSQYGFMSILLPSVVPAPNAWAALYAVQAILYAVVAAGMFIVLRSLRAGYVAYLLALAVTATTLFFRPRAASLLLAAQMTPAGGPMRFFWCYVVLAVIAWKFVRGDRVGTWMFAICGTAVWLVGVAWSAESAIYCSAAWFGAYAVFLIQNFARRDDGARLPPRQLAVAVALPVVAVVLWITATSLIYRVMDGHPPDWMSYYEYALLFSGGYSALVIDPHGPVWYLVALFALVSTAGIYFLRSTPLHPRVLVAAGAWGTVWSVSSYFVSRSHPVNLLSLVPLLVFSAALVVHAARGLSDSRWKTLAHLVFVPLLIVPPALTLAHRDIIRELRRPQLAPRAIASQIPPMDSSLASLAVAAGMTPADPVFLVSDGKWIMPPWPAVAGGEGVRTSETSWMPKPYEMISTLPPGRRNAYMSRFTDRMRTGGWLVQKKSELSPAFEELLLQLGLTHSRTKAYENEKWIIQHHVPRRKVSNQP